MLPVTLGLITPIHSADTPPLFTFQQGLDDHQDSNDPVPPILLTCLTR